MLKVPQRKAPIMPNGLPHRLNSPPHATPPPAMTLP